MAAAPGPPVPVGPVGLLRLPRQSEQYALRERVFKSVAYYTLSDEETDTVLYSDEDECKIFLMGLVNATMAKVKYEMGNATRAHFQDIVFCSILRSETIQNELGFNGVQSMEEI